MRNSQPLDHLIRQLSSLPGLGNRSARRIALHLLQKRDTTMRPLASALEQAADQVEECNTCNNLDMCNPCKICTNEARDRSKLCVVAQVSDVWAIERTGAFKGTYHVLGGVLSALDGIGPDDLKLYALEQRLTDTSITELILALSATVDGQSTAHYVSDRALNVNETLEVTRLAHGVPVGGELDYLDEGTITTALKSRRSA